MAARDLNGGQRGKLAAIEKRWLEETG